MGTRLFIAGLAWRTTEEGLARHLSSVGEVTWLRVVIDRETGRSKGFAFAEMAAPAQAERAVRELHGQPLDDRPLTVEEAGPRPERHPGSVRSGDADRSSRPDQRQAARDPRPARSAW